MRRRRKRKNIEAGRAGGGSQWFFFAALFLCVGVFIGYISSDGRTATAPVAVAPVANPAIFAQDEATYLAMVRSNPQDAHAMVHLGNLYYDHGRFRDAVNWYGRSLDLEPGNVSARTDRGTSYWNLGEPEKAIEEFRKSLQADGSHAQTLYNLGVVQLHGMKNPAEARRAWERLLEANPAYPEKQKVLQQLATLPPGSALQFPLPADSRRPGAARDMEEFLQRMTVRN